MAQPLKHDLVWLDLCSGLGGASQPALDRGWRVIRIDIESRFKPDIMADVRNLPLKPFHVDVLWASPPCKEFAMQGTGWMRPKHVERKDPDLSLVEGCIRAVKDFRPRYWIIENVARSIPFLTEILGPFYVHTGGHVLWGKVPALLPQCRAHKGPISGKWKDRVAAMRRIYGLPDSWYPAKWRDEAALRAKIPYEIGEAICRAVERRSADSDALAVS